MHIITKFTHDVCKKANNCSFKTNHLLSMCVCKSQMSDTNRQVDCDKERKTLISSDELMNIPFTKTLETPNVKSRV